MGIDLIYIIEILPALLKAMLVTLRIAISGYLLAFILGLLIAMIRVSGNVFLSRLLLMFTEFIRLTPILVQLFFFYYVLPEVGIKLPAEPTGIIVLGLHYSTFTAEVFRSGILAIPKGQWEVSNTLCLPFYIKWFKIILPQSIRPMIPALGNYLIQLFKEVPLLSTITVYELLNTANLIAGETFRYFEVLSIVAILFFLIELKPLLGSLLYKGI